MLVWLLLASARTPINAEPAGGSFSIQVETFPVGATPYGLGFDGANIWVANYFGNSVTVRRASDGLLIDTYSAGANPAGLAWDGGHMWISNNGGGSVTQLTGAGNLVRTVPVGSSPIGVAFDGTKVWVANWGSGLGGTLSALNAANGQHVMTPTVGAGPFGLAFDGSHLWVGNASTNTVSVIRASDGFAVMTPTVGSGPLSLAHAEAHTWVANHYEGNISVLDTATGQAVMTPTVGLEPFGVAYDGTYVWVANHGDDSVWVLDAITGGFVVSTTVGDKPQGLVFDGSSIWVANNGSHTVSKLTLVEILPPTETRTATSTGSASLVPTQTPPPTATSTPSASPAPGATASATPFRGAFLPGVLRQPTPSPSPTATPTQTPTLTNTPTQAPTQLPPGVHVLGNHTSYVDSIDYLNIAGEIHNNTGSTLRFVRVAANVFNASAQLVGTDYTYTYLDNLPPFTKTCFVVSMPRPSGWAYYRFEAPTYWTDGAAPPNLTIFDSRATWNPYPYLDVIGQVRNDHGSRVEYVQVVATLHSSTNQALDCWFSYVNSTHLDPGQTSSVRISFFGRASYANTATYRLQVDGNTQ
jgi:YVTN family beta-propeller protein